MALSTMNEQIYRYEETGRTFKLQNYTEWAVPAVEGVFEDMPNWLRLIRTAAEVGGVLEENRVSYPPPMFILWFRTDAEHNLLSFGREPDINNWWKEVHMGARRTMGTEGIMTLRAISFAAASGALKKDDR